MIKHVVCYKLKNDTPENREIAVNALKSMREAVDEAISVEVGTDFLGSGRSFGVVLIVTLKDREMLEAYQNNEFHCKRVKPIVRSLTAQSVSVDFECD